MGSFLIAALKRILCFLHIDRLLPKSVIDWYSLHTARRTAASLGIQVKVDGDKLIVRKGDHLLVLSSRHLIYAQTLVLDFDVIYGSVEYDSSKDGNIVDYSTPGWHRLKPSGKRVFLTCFSEGEAVNALYLEHGQISAGDIVLDLGANCGIATLSFSEAVGAGGSVIALEPDPINFEALKKNVEYHQLKNVHPLHAGVWSHDGTISFNADGSMGATAVSKVARGEFIKIPVVSLLGLVTQAGVSRVSCVKMDIEGAEYEVILSSGEFLDRYQARWVVEVHDADRIDLLVTAFQCRGYATKIVNQGESHEHPLLVASPGVEPI